MTLRTSLHLHTSWKQSVLVLGLAIVPGVCRVRTSDHNKVCTSSGLHQWWCWGGGDPGRWCQWSVLPSPASSRPSPPRPAAVPQPPRSSGGSAVLVSTYTPQWGRSRPWRPWHSDQTQHGHHSYTGRPPGRPLHSSRWEAPSLLPWYCNVQVAPLLYLSPSCCFTIRASQRRALCVYFHARDGSDKCYY